MGDETESAADGQSGDVRPSVLEGTYATLCTVLNKQYRHLRLEATPLLFEIEV